MARRSLAPACAIVVATLAATGVRAQDVHKCVVDGQVSYQAGPCAGGADAVLPVTAGPTEQEARQAAADLSRQRYQAATGRYIRPYAAAPVPVPIVTPQAPMTTISRSSFAPAATPTPATGTTTTTVTVLASQGADSTFVRVRTTRPSTPPAPDPLRAAAAATNAALAAAQAAANTPRLSNCEQLNRENGDLQDRLAELAAPGELRTRDELRANAQAQLDQVRTMARASQCRLRR